MLHSRLIIPSVDIYQSWDISDLMKEFQSLVVRNEQEVDDIETELKNLAIIREVAARIEQKSHRHPLHIESQSEGSANYSSLLNQCCYFFVLAFGILQRSVGSYLFGSTIFALIPHISSPILIAMSSLFVVFDSLLFYAFEVSFLKAVMGMKEEKAGASLLNQIYLEQRRSAKIINRSLENISSLQWKYEERQKLISCKEQFNAHLLEKLKTMTEPKKTWGMVCLEYSVIAFGAFSSIVDSYFAFTVLHLSIGTPIGFVLAIGMVVAGLTLYYGMGVQSVSKLVNPSLESFEELKEKLSSFNTKFCVVVSETNISRFAVFGNAKRVRMCPKKDVLNLPMPQSCSN